MSLSIISDPPPPHYFLCNETITLSVNIFQGVGPFSYSWIVPGYGILTTPTVEITTPFTGDIFLTVTDDNGCQAFASIHIKAYGALVDIVYDPAWVCAGDTLWLSAWPDFPAGTTFIWSNGQTTQDAYVLTSGTYSVTVTAPSGCSGTASETVTILPEPAPFPIIVGPTSLCAGQNATLTVDGGPFYGYWWSDFEQDPTMDISGPGIYWVEVWNEVGCINYDEIEILGGSVQPQLNAPAPICTGQSTTLEVTNASSFTSFNWSNGGSGPSISVSTPGTYTVTVSAGGSCSATGSVEVTSSSSNISVSGSTTANTSCAATNGEVDITPSPSGTYSFNWSNSATTEDIANLAAGSYTVTASDAGGCTASASFTVANNTTPPVPTATATPSTCGQSNGAVDLIVTPSGSYTFAWSNGATTEDLTDIAAGTYNVTATSTASGCSATTSATVTNNTTTITVTGNVTQPSGGGNNGAIDITITPSGTYTYAWSNGATAEDLTGLGEGTYTVTATDGGGCTGTASFVLIESGGGCPLILSTSVSVPNPGVVCEGESITISSAVSGGTAPYTYAWSNGQTTPSFTVPAPFNQTLVLTVTDDNGCTAVTSIHVKVNVWYVDINYSQIPVCEGGSLTLIASTTAEIPGTTYTWSTGQTGFMIEVTSSGTYSVSMTHPDVPCTATDVVTVTIGGGNTPTPQVNGPATLCPGQNATLNVGGGSFTDYLWQDGSTNSTLQITDPGTYSVTVTNADGCTGSDAIDIQPGGALPAMNAPTAICPGQSTAVEVTNPGEFTNFQWSNGSSGPSITVNAPGTYTVTVTGTGSCTATGSAEVNSSGSNVSISGVATPVSSCTSPNGEIDITLSPAGSYTYNWSNGETTEDLTSIAVGTYTVVVTDGGGCTASASFAVANNTTQPLATAAATPATCGQSNGSVNLSILPSGSYSYLWSNGETTEDLTDVAPGTYEVVVTAIATGCTAAAAATVQDNTISIAVTGTATPNTACNGSNGSISTTAFPSGTYSYLWSNGMATEDIVGLAAGSYSVTLSAGGTCSSTAIFSVAEAADFPGLSAIVVPAVCGNAVGAIDLSVSPTGSYAFTWSSGASTEDLANIAPGDYAVTVTSASGCSATDAYNVPNNSNNFTLGGAASPVTNCGAANGGINLTVSPTGKYDILWSNGETTEDLMGIAAGSYIVTVSQGGACTASASFTVENQVVQPTLSQGASPAFCGQANGGVDLFVIPQGNYSISWSNGATSEDLTGVASGNYSVTVTGSNGCLATMAATVAENTTTIALTGNAVPNTSCMASNGGIDLNATPTGNYTYLWSNGATSEDLTSVAAGNYIVTVSAGGSCSATGSYTVPNNSGAPSLGIVIDAAACGLSNGNVNLTASPSGTYIYLWSNGATTEDLTGIAAGTYSVTVTGSNGCSATSSALVMNSPAIFTPNTNVTPVSSCTAANGSIDLSVAPSGSYTFLWSTEASTEDLTGIAAGSYTVTITQGATCSTTATYVVMGGSTAPSLSQSNSPATCGQSNGSIDLAATPNGTYSYLWSTGATSEDLMGIAPGTYTVTCTGANGCTTTLSAIVANLNSNFSLSTVPTASSSCILASGQVNLSVSPTGIYTFLWSNGATNEDLTGVAAGNYSVTVTDASGCADLASVTVGGPVQPLVSIGGPAAACEGASATISATSGFASYLWSNGQTGSSISVSQPNNYSVTATDANGCTATANHDLGNFPQPTPTVTGPGTICGGSTEFEVTGGVFTQTTWSTGATTPNITVSQSGTYSVTVTDANGCTASDALTLMVGSSLSPDITATLEDCNGTASLDAGSGFASYLWSNPTGGTGATTQVITVVAAGIYSVTVSDASGCTGTAVENYTPPTPPTVEVLGASAHCEGDVSVLVASGNFPQYLWSTGETTPQISVTQGGTYSVTASDTNGCMASGSWTVTVLQPNFITVEQFTCSAQDAGNVQVTLTNQFGCDSVVTVVTLLSNPTTTNLTLEACNGESINYNGVSILAGTTQEVVLFAANGCDSVVVVTVLSLPSITYELSATKTCWNIDNGSIELNIFGGKEPFLFSLDGGEFLHETFFPGLTAGTHSITVQDNNGCRLVLDAMVPQTNPSALVVEDATINCEQGSVNLQPTLISEHPAAVVWTWPDGSHLSSFEVGKEGVYTVQVDDGCEVLERDIQVKWEALYYENDLFYVPNSFSPNGDGINDDFRVFMAPHAELLSFEFRVFDRWGDEQFATFDVEKGWDGTYRETQRQIDVHVWFVKAQVTVCGSRVVNVFKEGGVTIMR